SARERALEERLERLTSLVEQMAAKREEETSEPTIAPIVISEEDLSDEEYDEIIASPANFRKWASGLATRIKTEAAREASKISRVEQSRESAVQNLVTSFYEKHPELNANKTRRRTVS